MFKRFAAVSIATVLLISQSVEAEKKKSRTNTPKMCWMDYCPCSSIGGISKILCRNLRAGIPVSAREMSVGAAQRDALIEVQNSPY